MSSLDFLTPVGRLVGGDPFKPMTTNMQNQPLVVQQGPNKGQPRVEYVTKIAFSKQQADFPAFYAKVVEFARQCWPQLWNPQTNWFTHPQFSIKFNDGDGLDWQGQSQAGKEGYAGHFILSAKSGFAPKVYHTGRYAENERITDASLVRRGYYVRIAGRMESNNNAQKPGIYVNVSMVELVGLGPEITSGPDASGVFGAAPVAALPVGAQALPAYTPPAALPGMAMAAALPVGGNPLGAGTGFVPPAVIATPAAPIAVVPNPAILGMPPAALPLPPAAPVGPRLAPALTAAGHTYEAMRAAGWTDDTMRAAGHLV